MILRTESRLSFAVIAALGTLLAQTRPAAMNPFGTGKDIEGTWAAASRTAVSITGNVAFTSNKLTILHKDFPLTLVREIDRQHLAEVGKIVDYLRPPSSARLYRTLISRRSILVNGNTICGPNADAKWILAVADKNELSLAFFSSDSEPKLDYGTVSTGHDLCGTYSYVMSEK